MIDPPGYPCDPSELTMAKDPPRMTVTEAAKARADAPLTRAYAAARSCADSGPRSQTVALRRAGSHAQQPVSEPLRASAREVGEYACDRPRAREPAFELAARGAAADRLFQRPVAAASSKDG
jgi:hypothetical protein